MNLLKLVSVEQGVKDAIAALKRPYIRTIATYGGEFDDDLRYVVAQFPAVWTTFKSAKPTNLSARKVQYELTLVVLVGARSLRTEETARHGVVVDGKRVNVGTYQLLDDVIAALANRKIDCATPLSLGKIDTIFNSKTNDEAISVLSIEFSTSVVFNINDRVRDELDDSMPDLTHLNLNYYFQPQDDVSDETDIVALRSNDI